MARNNRNQQPAQNKKVDISLEEKLEIDAIPTEQLIQVLAVAHANMDDIQETKKADPHLNELKLELKDINGDYKARLDMAAAKRNYVIGVLKNRRQS